MEKMTLGYASAFCFNSNCPVKFYLGKKYYQFVQTIYDKREYDGEHNTIIVAYDYKMQKYVCLFGETLEKEIVIVG